MNIWQHLKSIVAGARPAAGTVKHGELFTNTPDRQLGMGNELNNPVDLLAVRYHSDTANYILDDVVVVNGTLHRCIVPHEALAFDVVNWTPINKVPIGGIADQSLLKVDGDNYNVYWGDGPWVKWKGDWVQATYPIHSFARDGSFAGITNQETDERLAPQPTGLAQWLLPDVPVWTDKIITNVVKSGIRLTNITEAYEITNYRLWISSISPSATYQLFVKDVNTGVVKLGTKFTGAQVGVLGWLEVTGGDEFIVPGDDYLIGVISNNTSGDTLYNHPWTWEGDSNQENDPGIGNANRRGNHTQLRINTTDDDGTDRTAELAQIIPGSTIKVAAEANLSAYLLYEIIDGVDNGTWGNYNVVLLETGAGGEPNTGARCQLYFEIPVASPTDYVELPSHFAGSSTLTGVLEIGNDPAIENDTAYGIDITVQLFTVSTHWDLLPSGGSSSSGSDGGTPVTIVDDLLSTDPTAALSANMGRELDAIKADLDHDHQWADITDPPATYPPSAHSLDSHSDVSVGTPSHGDRVAWDDLQQLWVPKRSTSALGIAEFDYRATLPLDTTPNSGRFSRDTDPVTVTTLYLHKEDAGSHDLSLFYENMKAGDWMNIHHRDNTDHFESYDLTGTPILNVDVWEVPVLFYSMGGDPITNNERVAIFWRNVSPDAITDHGQLTGRNDDDHTQYHTDGRGDLRYAPLTIVYATEAEAEAGSTGDTSARLHIAPLGS